MPQGHLILRMRRQLEGGEWLSQDSDPAPPRNGCLPHEGLSCPFTSLVLPTSAWKASWLQCITVYKEVNNSIAITMQSTNNA